MSSDESKFVSRGGIKLEFALKQFGVEITGKTILDLGSSTGGFVDCLLQNGAVKVYSVDTSYGELAWKLRNDPRVVVIERKNALHLEDLGEKVDLITIDVGWTKLEKILPVAKQFLTEGGRIIALLKPHYEADKKFLKKGVLDQEEAERVKNEVCEKLKSLGFDIVNQVPSLILGGEGNREYLLLIKV